MVAITETGDGSRFYGVKRFLTLLGPQVRRVLIGLFLIAAFAATGAVLLFVLTAQQLQSAMSAPDLATTKSTIGAIRQDVHSIEIYYKVSGVISQKQTDTEQALSDANAGAQAALSGMTSSADDITAFIGQNETAYIQPPLVLKPFGSRPAPQAAPSGDGPGSVAADGTPRLGSSPASLERPAAPAEPVTPFVQSPILDFGGSVTAYFADYYAALGTNASPDGLAARRALDTFRQQVNGPLKAYQSAHGRYDAAMATVQALTVQRDALNKQQRDLDDTVAPKGSSLANDAYWNLCEDFLSFKTLVGENAYHIVLLPKMMLVLTLSIFMGILGSLIHISQGYVTDPDGRGLWDILFRVGLGAGVAFALFFFAAAGMLAMTQGSSEAQADMSPYLISFLGITGGYLSDRVTQWMREVGENTFKVAPGGAPPRWAVGLDAALKAAGLTDATLAASAGATAAEVEDWVALKKPVPGEKQALVSAFLRVHPSGIFTDIAPA